MWRKNGSKMNEGSKDVEGNHDPTSRPLSILGGREEGKKMKERR
jgi:hypothetical protein